MCEARRNFKFALHDGRVKGASRVVMRVALSVLVAIGWVFAISTAVIADDAEVHLDTVGVFEGQVAVKLRFENAFDEDMHQSIRSGLPITIRCRRSRSRESP